MTSKLNLRKTLDHFLDFEKLKYCFECGICTASCPVAELLPDQYNPRILLHHLSLDDEAFLNSAEFWLCAWCYHCYRHCPQGLKVPEIFRAVRKFAVEHGYMEGFNKSLNIIQQNIPLPASCCHVCFHPERSLTDNQLIADAIQNYILNCDTEKNETQSLVPVHTEKVAIIGSGPAGLSAAHDLAKKGYSVTVFEALSSPGGMLRRSIPEYRLPKKTLDSDIKRLKRLGIRIKTNVIIGKNLTIKKLLQQGYSAVFVATGAHEDRTLEINGAELNGVFTALDFLEKANKIRVGLSDKVSVIGGGNVAVDSARTALKHGAKEVTILYRRSKEEMPASPWEIKEAEEDGVKFEFLVAPRRILGRDGNVSALECVKMELGEPDETGRRRPVPVQGSEFKIETGIVIIAIGQVPNTFFLPKTVKITEANTIITDPFTLETDSRGIFAGGDAVSGTATVIEAIIAGKRAAVSIDCYLKGIPLEPLTVIEKAVGV